MGRMDGRVAVVTGAAYGIGRAVAERLATEGATVVVADRAVDAGAATAAAIGSGGGQARFVACDVASMASVEAMVAEAIAVFGRIDVLVNNAGIPGPSRQATEMPEEDWLRVIDVNLSGVYRCAKAALPYLVASGRGAIVNLASTFGMIGAHNTPAYAASKGGVIALTRQLAIDYGPQGVRVNAVSPGYVDNDMDRRRTRMTAEDAAANLAAREAAAALQPLGRQGDVAEIAAAIAFLCSDDASFMTGVVMPIDGGCTASFNSGGR